MSELKRVKGADFEAVDGKVMMVAPNSGQVSADLIPPVRIEGSSTTFYLISKAYADLAGIKSQSML